MKDVFVGVGVAWENLRETEVVDRALTSIDWGILLGLEFRKALAVRGRERELLVVGEIGETRVGVGWSSEGTAVRWSIGSRRGLLRSGYH